MTNDELPPLPKVAADLTTSAEIDKLAAALAKAQGQIRNPPKNKTASVPMKAGGTYKYDYADLADVIDALRKPFADNGLSMIQPASTPHSGVVVITTRLMHESGQWLQSSLALGVGDDKPQTLGAAITYGRRYSAASMAGLSPDADNDANEHEGQPREPAPAPAKRAAKVPAPKAPEPPAPATDEPERFDPKNKVHVERLRRALVSMNVSDEDEQDKIAHALIGEPMVASSIEKAIAIVGLPF